MWQWWCVGGGGEREREVWRLGRIMEEVVRPCSRICSMIKFSNLLKTLLFRAMSA